MNANLKIKLSKIPLKCIEYSLLSLLSVKPKVKWKRYIKVSSLLQRRFHNKFGKYS